MIPCTLCALFVHSLFLALWSDVYIMVCSIMYVCVFVCVNLCVHMHVHACMVIIQFLLYLQHETIEQLLERGEKLDDLVQKTDHLSGTSKAFYKEVFCIIKSS